jgi:hypothetical protein
MKKIFSTIVLVLIVATPAKSEFAILGFGKESCSTMALNTSTGSQMDQVYQFAYTAYILGFFYRGKRYGEQIYRFERNRYAFQVYTRIL